MATNGRKRYFNIDENASTEQIYALLDDVESADEDYIDNLMNDSDTEFITEITQAAILQNISLTTSEANLHIVPSDNQSKKKEKNNNKQKGKSYQTRILSPHARNRTQSK